MFTSLHALAQAATLLVVITAEGADQLRINVTPTRTDDKTKPHKLRPLSLVGTPDELDEGFADALAEWQAPRRSLVEQARDAGGDEDGGAAPTAKASKANAAAPEKKAESAPAAVKGKPGRKPKATADAAPADAAGGDAAGADAGGGDAAAADAGGGDAAGADAAPAGAASGAAPGAGAAGDPAADEFTLDLF